MEKISPDILKLMEQGALDICDNAIKKLYSGDYGKDEQMIKGIFRIEKGIARK